MNWPWGRRLQTAVAQYLGGGGVCGRREGRREGEEERGLWEGEKEWVCLGREFGCCDKDGERGDGGGGKVWLETWVGGGGEGMLGGGGRGRGE